MSTEITVHRARTLKEKPMDESKLGFGKIFTDHMFTMAYSPEKGWHDAQVRPYGPLSLDPSAMVFHYGQEIFEGLKCYRRTDGGLSLFRPMDNFRRMNVSCERLCMQKIDEELAMAGLLALLKTDADWVPSAPGTTLYIRPTIIATDSAIGVHASHTYLFFIILSPVGAYYANGLAPIGIYVEDHFVRAVRGGVGFTKSGGNYAASILASEEAAKKGYAQVLWLDGVEQKYIEEVGSMNMFFKIAGKIVTPQLNGSILSGITRDSVLKLCVEMGVPAEERRVSLQEIFDAAAENELEEAFGTGTAAVISPVGELKWGERTIMLNGGRIGQVSQRLYDTLTGIQYGRLPDPHGWIVRVT